MNGLFHIKSLRTATFVQSNHLRGLFKKHSLDCRLEKKLVSSAVFSNLLLILEEGSLFNSTFLLKFGLTSGLGRTGRNTTCNSHVSVVR